ncbi:sortase family protein [Lactococcus garvieae]|uniref:sortase family protein n=1 Tax=Lactococcus garvieae TaxID=1363 RepID=UPI0009BF8A69|nr:class C sortase [Lactococcus garvieae]
MFKKQKNIRDKAVPPSQERRKVSPLLIFAFLLIFIGVGILIYPIIGNYMANQQRSVATSSYNDSLKKMSQKERKQQWALAKKYNQYIFDRQEGKVGHPVDYSKVISNGNPPVMGTIDIPAINVNNLPFYHGTSYGTLDKGVGHFESSSVPIGGKNTRAVLSGHSGLENQVLFTDIRNLKEGDIFFINILGKKLAYEIDSFQEVLPREVDKVKIIPGEDRVTLLTCTPPGINTYRLLVNGKRIPYKEATSKKTSKRNIWTYQTVVMGSLGLCFLLFVILFLLYRIFLKQSHKTDPEVSARAMKRIRRLIMVTRGMFVVMLVIMISILALAIYGYFRMQTPSSLPTINVGKQHELAAYNPDKILKGDYDESKIASVNVSNFAESRKELQHTVNESGIGKLYIPKEEVSLPILAGLSQTNLMSGASTYRQGQKLGKGNYVLLAHNIYNVNTNTNVDVLFNRISNLTKGDKIYATDFQNLYEYQVIKNEVIKDTQVDVVKSKVKGPPILTLIRCEGNVGTIYRRLVQGRLTKIAPLSLRNSKAMNLRMTSKVRGDDLIKKNPISQFEQLAMDLAAHIIADPMQVMIPFFLLLVMPILFLNFI